MSETALLTYFVINNELRSTCDFNPYPLQKGKQVYEVIRIIDGKPLFLQEHLKRFFKSAEIGGFTLPVNNRDIVKRLKALIEANRLVNGNIEFLVHFGENSEKDFMAWVTPYTYPTDEMYKNGVSVSIMEAMRKHPNAKAFNRRLRSEADKIINERNVYEVILKNKEGYITEGSRSNVFFIKNQKLFTPPLSMVLPGITRMKIFEICNEQSIEIIEKNIKFSHISDFDSCFLTGTSPKVLPIKSINEISFDTGNALLRNIMLWYDKKIENYLKSFDFEKVEI